MGNDAMKKLLFLLLFPVLAAAQTYNLFKPANGVLKGATTTYATTTATGVDVAAAFSGTCNTTTYLRGDGSCQTPAGTSSGANPTATVGTSAVNGAATTFMRSDAAPAIDLTMSPTWSSTHTWTATTNHLAVNVSGSTVTAIGAGINRSATTTLGFVTNATLHGSIGPTGLFTNQNGRIDAGTKFTAVGTGCTVGTTTGGATGGTFALATGPCTSVVVTMAGATGATAPSGWTCQAHDRTSAVILIGGESTSTATTATFTIPVGAGTTDVISFNCTGY